MNYSITFTSSQFNILKEHLYPGDNKEAIAFALCGRRAGVDRHRLVVQEIISVPYEQCSRTAIQLEWSTALLPEILENAVDHKLSLVKIHSHPNDVNKFSATDDISDKTLFESVYGWTGEDIRHASAILFENNQFIGRIICPDGRFQAVSTFQIVGDNVIIQHIDNCLRAIRPAGKRVAQTFGAGTYDKLEKMKIAVIGCSGTGGPVVEMLARNCVGDLVLVDPDIVEEKNLNRIPNAFLTDVQNKELKVTVLKKAILEMGTGTNVLAIPKNIIDPQAILAVAECDYIFGCMDGIEGRHILNRLATFYSIPYSDIGVKLIADGKGGIIDICGTVHYLQPGGSSLMSRKLYTPDQLRAESLKRTDEKYYKKLVKEKYIVGGNEERPAVMPVNMHVATFAVNDFLARIHPFRSDSNSDFSIQRFSLANSIYHHEASTEPCQALEKYVGCGDVTPLLDMPNLSKKEKAA